MKKKKCISASNCNFNKTCSKNKPIISKNFFYFLTEKHNNWCPGLSYCFNSNTQLLQSIFKIKWSSMGRKGQWRLSLLQFVNKEYLDVSFVIFKIYPSEFTLAHVFVSPKTHKYHTTVTLAPRESNTAFFPSQLRK